MKRTTVHILTLALALLTLAGCKRTIVQAIEPPHSGNLGCFLDAHADHSTGAVEVADISCYWTGEAPSGSVEVVGNVYLTLTGGAP